VQALQEEIALARAICARPGIVKHVFHQRVTSPLQAVLGGMNAVRLSGKPPARPRSRTSPPADPTRGGRCELYAFFARHMFNWAVGREYLERSPLRRGNQPLIHREQEDNYRHRRVSPDEEQRILAQCPAPLRSLVIAALDTG